MIKEPKLSDVFISYSAKIRRVVSRIVHPEDIDDIVQDTFVRSYEANLKQEIKYSRSYMLKTAKNLALNHIAKWDNKFNDSIEEFSEPPIELISQNFEDEFESKERFLVFVQATNQLATAVRKCFILKKVYGLSQKEIAKYYTYLQKLIFIAGFPFAGSCYFIRQPQMMQKSSQPCIWELFWPFPSVSMKL